MRRVRQKAHFLLVPVEFELLGPIRCDHTLTDQLMQYRGHATKMLQSRQSQERQYDHTELRVTCHNLDIVGELHL